MNITILSTADWNAKVWTNKQHIASRLSTRHEVTYIESIGLRAPRLNRADLTRILRRFNRAKAPISHTSGVTVVGPKILPWHGNHLVDALNRRLLRRQLGHRDTGRVLWTYSPITCGLDEEAEVVIYHAVDLMHTFPGVNRNAILAAERRLLQRAHHVIASSAGIRDHLNSQGRQDVLLWENVADTALFSIRDGAARAPRAVFWGNLTETKIDFALLLELAEAGVELALAGPVGIDGTSASPILNRLLRHENVKYLGLLTPDALASLAGTARVGLIPYNLDAHTAGIFPMKVYEYLSAGLSVISTRLPSLEGSGVRAEIRLEERENFVGAVRDALAEYDQTAAAQVSSRIRSKSWARRMEQIEALLPTMRS